MVYFALFGAGAFYILRLMREPPHPAEPGLPPDEPMRAAGIMPGAGHGAGRRPAAGGVRRRWTLDLPFIWAGLIAFAVLAYVSSTASTSASASCSRSSTARPTATR